MAGAVEEQNKRKLVVHAFFCRLRHLQFNPLDGSSTISLAVSDDDLIFSANNTGLGSFEITIVRREITAVKYHIHEKFTTLLLYCCTDFKKFMQLNEKNKKTICLEQSHHGPREIYRLAFCLKPTNKAGLSCIKAVLKDIDWAETTEAESMDAVNMPNGITEIEMPNRNAEIIPVFENDVLDGSMDVDQSSASGYTDCKKVITYPSPQASDSVTITTLDLECLEPENLLNDNLIDFYIKYIYYDRLTDYLRDKTYICNSFFMTHLDRHKVNHVSRWTKNVDIFSKHYIVIPVHQQEHWFLTIICSPGEIESVSENSVSSTIEPSDGNVIEDEPIQIIGEKCTRKSGGSTNEDENIQIIGEKSPRKSGPKKIKNSLTRLPCILIFDSLEGTSYDKETRLLRLWLQTEWKHKRKTNLTFSAQTVPAFPMSCPQQTNFSDCGLYLFQYLESFIDDPFHFDGALDGLPNLREWFPEEKITRKRGEIRRLIHTLKNKGMYTSSTPSR